MNVHAALAVFYGRIDLLRATNPAYDPALTTLMEAINKAAYLIEAIDAGELSACEECGCTVEDGECTCPGGYCGG